MTRIVQQQTLPARRRFFILSVSLPAPTRAGRSASFSAFFRDDLVYRSCHTRNDEVSRDEPNTDDDAHRPRRRGGGGERVAGRALALQSARRNR